MAQDLREFPQNAHFAYYLGHMQTYYSAAEQEINAAKQLIANQDAELKYNRERVNQLDQENQELKSELNGTKLRLSAIMGMKISNNNPDIADLSDENRPTKIAEMFTELYDNTWTNAYEILEADREEAIVIKCLLDILKATYIYCEERQKKQMEEVRRTLLLNESETIPDFVMKFIKENKKRRADSLCANEYEIFMEIFTTNKSALSRIALDIPDFTKECFKICYLMSIQDPPVVFDTFDISPGDTLDKNTYRVYTQSGEKIRYLVWPCLRLCKNGGVLTKGVVQCFQSLISPIRSKSRPTEDRQNRMSSAEMNKQTKEGHGTASLNQMTASDRTYNKNQSTTGRINEHYDEVAGAKPKTCFGNSSESERLVQSPKEDQRSNCGGNRQILPSSASGSQLVETIHSTRHPDSASNDRSLHMINPKNQQVNIQDEREARDTQLSQSSTSSTAAGIQRPSASSGGWEMHGNVNQSLHHNHDASLATNLTERFGNEKPVTQHGTQVHPNRSSSKQDGIPYAEACLETYKPYVSSLNLRPGQQPTAGQWQGFHYLTRTFGPDATKELYGELYNNFIWAEYPLKQN